MVAAKDRPLGFELESKHIRSYRINDMFTVRKAINDCIWEYLLEECGLIFCTRVENFRMLVGTLSVIVGVTSHVYPMSFPEIVPLLCWCIVVWHILAVILFYIHRYLEGDAFFVGAAVTKKSKDYSDSLQSYLGGALVGKSIKLSSDVSPYEHFYTLEAKLLGPVPQFIWQTRKVHATVSTKVSIGKFFDSGGYIYPPNIKETVDELLGQLLAEQNNSKKKK